MYKNIPEQLRPKETFAGQLDPAFLYADKMTRENMWVEGERQRADFALSASEKHRLVKGPISPTPEQIEEKNQKLLAVGERLAHSKDLKNLHRHNMAMAEIESLQIPFGSSSEHEFKRMETPLETAGTKTVIERREWCDEYRIRTEVEAGQQVTAPEGPRETTMLSSRGAKNIAESCAYVAAERRGYTTFATMTFRDEAVASMEYSAGGEYCQLSDRPKYTKGHTPSEKSRIYSGQYSRFSDKPKSWKPWSTIPVQAPSSAGDKELRTTIQKEVSRCLDAWQKIYKRGIPAAGIQGNTDTLDYVWVVEVPESEGRERNPHVHILMRWKVPFEKFRPWAERLERAWGQGFATLEKIKDPQAAGAYMAKAAGYLCKASGKEDQGVVIGNRYGISEKARAPEWEKIGEGQLHIMGQLIADVYDHMTELHGEDFQLRKRMNEAREHLLEASKTEECPEKKIRIKQSRKNIADQLMGVRNRINAIPVRANKYQLIIKGALSFSRFMSWAKSDSKDELVPAWLPDKPAGAVYIEGRKPEHIDKGYIEQLHRTSRVMKNHRIEKIKKVGAATTEVCAAIVEQVTEFKDWANTGWNEYERGVNYA